MNIEIKIASNGVQPGTVGWLANGLKTGTLFFKEGIVQGGNHALWLKGPEGMSQYLAEFNPYGLDGSSNLKIKYEISEEDQRLGLWTDASWESLKKVAQKWCDELNSAREAEEAIEIGMVRVEASKDAA